MVFNYCLNNDFKETKDVAVQLATEEETMRPPVTWGFALKRKCSDDAEPQHRKVQKSRQHATDEFAGGHELAVALPSSEVSPLPSTCQLEQAEVACNEAKSPSIGKGSRVEVLEEEDGLQYWVGGSVVEIVNGEALVKLDRPQYGAMQEWVPLHGSENFYRLNTNQPYSGNSNGIHDGNRALQAQRPRIRLQVEVDTLERGLINETGVERSLVPGELVEAWINDRWQEGMVSDLQDSLVIVNFSTRSVSSAVECNKLRLAPSWQGERWIWRPTGAASNHEPSVPCQQNDDALVSTIAERTGQLLLTESSENQHVGQREVQFESLGGMNKSGNVTTSLVLYQEKNENSSPTLSGSRRDSHHAISQESPEKPYSRVYKRRGLAINNSMPTDSLGTEVTTGRPSRTRKLPSKLRNEDTVMTEVDGPVPSENNLSHENAPQDQDGDFVPKATGVKDATKSKQGRPKKDTVKVKGVKIPKDTGTLKNSKHGSVGEKGKQDTNENSNKKQWISPHEYAARSEFLTPLSLAWSPKYEDEEIDDGSDGQKAQKFSLLGAGMKSGRVSLWRIDFPSSYSVDPPQLPVPVSFLGFLLAHKSWVNSLSWASCCNFGPLKPNSSEFLHSGRLREDTLLLATGCADGSVKLWVGLSRELAGSNSVNHLVPFEFLSEVVTVDYAPVMALALFVPPGPGDRALLAVGKGSGSVGVWELNSSGTHHQICSHDRAHEQMVTGFSWTSDGRCLYSCGQDSLKRWDLAQDQLLPLPFPDGSSLFPSIISSDICSMEALESFYGVTLSPNGLALAAVRGIASDLLDQMYQARSQKGMVQLFWLGNQHIDIKDGNEATQIEVVHTPKAMLGRDNACWELSIIDALEHLQHPRKNLVLWDVVAALLALKERHGIEEVVSIVAKWLSSWGPGQGAVGAIDAFEWSTGSFQKAIPETSCRKLQMMTVIYRKVFLSHIKTEEVRTYSAEDSSNGDDDKVKLWKEGLHLIEHELRQRLVHIHLQSAASEANKQGCNALWIQLHVEWVLSNINSVYPLLAKLATELQTTYTSTLVIPGRSEEACIFCDSSVSFESPESATCFGPDGKHVLQRCSVTMQVCPPLCLWHCSCCGRTALKQASSLLFSITSREQIHGLSLPFLTCSDSFPACPFCGILMHRLLPNFFLTPSLV